MILAQDWKKEEANIQPSYIQSMIIVSLETVPHFSKSLQYMVTLKEKWKKINGTTHSKMNQFEHTIIITMQMHHTFGLIAFK